MSDPFIEPNPPPRDGIIPDPNASQTEQILGVGADPDCTREQIDPKWRRFYDKLVRLHDDLSNAATDLQHKAREVNPDPIQDEPAEIGTSNYHRDELLGVATYDTELLEEVNDALTRLKTGKYGICLATGQPIPEERLEAVPWTRFTAEAQKEMEDRGEAIKASIGPQGNFDERGTAPAGPWRDHEGST